MVYAELHRVLRDDQTAFEEDLPPAEFEDIFYAPKRTDQPLVEIQ